MLRYSDCYPGCGGEDCPCCEIHAQHQGAAPTVLLVTERPRRLYPCDYGDCPFDAQYSRDCRYYCGLGVDEDSPPDEEEMLTE
jgi:hypothetical protein